MDPRWISLLIVILCTTAAECYKPCTVYDADTGKIVTNHTSVPRLRVDCSRRGLYFVPDFLPEKTYVLNLQGNNIILIPGSTFKRYTKLTYLYLSDNLLSGFNPDSFSGLNKLQVLTLGGNSLCLHNGYPNGVFKDLVSLKTLTTYGNECPNRHKSIPDQAFKDLVSLEKLSLDVTDELSFGDGFKELTNLTHLEVSSYNKCESYETVVRHGSFAGLENSKLTHLTLRGCAYNGIEQEALTVFPNLTTLNTACARNMNKSSLYEAIYNMKDSTLQTLILDGMMGLQDKYYLNIVKKALNMTNPKYVETILDQVSRNMAKDEPVSPLCHPKFVNLKRLSVRENLLISKLNLEKNGKSCLPNLNHINIGMNFIYDLIMYDYDDDNARNTLKFGFPTEYFWSLKNIRTVDASRLFYNTFFDANWFCSDRDLDTEDYFRKPPKLIQEIPDLENNFNVIDGKVKSIGSVNITDLDSFKGLVNVILVSPGTQVFFADWAVPAKVIDPSQQYKCPYVTYPYDTVTYLNLANTPVDLLTCPIVGTRSLRVLDASYCALTSFHPQNYFPNLTLLYLRGNKLNNTENFPEIFRAANRLTEIDLAQNGFKSLPDDSFERLERLEKLDMSQNMLTSVNLSILCLTKLKLLDLSSNIMPYLKEPFMSQVERLSQINPKFRLHLSGNPFTCECDSIPFLKWLKITNATMDIVNTTTCPSSTVLLRDVNIKKLEDSCMVSYIEYYVIIASLSTFVIFVTVSSIVAYRRRWKIAWHVYTIKRRLLRNNYKILGEDGNDKIYKAFVAYHIDHEIGNDPGITWVKNSLCHYVEEEWGHKLFVFDRNAAFGGSKIGETIYGIQESEKVIFVITATYLEKGNWEMVLYWALAQGLQNVVICCLEDIDVDKLPVALAKVAIQLQEKYPTNYLEFHPETDEGPHGMDMWNNLKLALDCDDNIPIE